MINFAPEFHEEEEMRTLFILLDSLRRDFLTCYGNDWVHTPNISRLAERSVVFDNHWVGSLPCMPARREFLTGRHNFLHRSWGTLCAPFRFVSLCSWLRVLSMCVMLY